MSKPDEVLRQCCQPKPDSKDSFLAVPTQEVRCAFKQPSKPTCPRKLACTRLKYGRVLRSDKASGKCRLLGLANCSGKASKTALSVSASCLQCETPHPSVSFVLTSRGRQGLMYISGRAELSNLYHLSTANHMPLLYSCIATRRAALIIKYA